MRLFALFVVVPIIEIALFIQVGGWLGLLPTLAIVIATAALGTWLVRRQGLAELAKIQSSFDRLSDPTRPLAHGAMILASGLLLLTPGFFTDAVGFALLVPGIRDAVMRYVAARISVSSFRMGAGNAPPEGAPRSARDEVIDADYHETTQGPVDVDEAPRGDQPRRPSGWTRG